MTALHSAAAHFLALAQSSSGWPQHPGFMALLGQ